MTLIPTMTIEYDLNEAPIKNNPRYYLGLSEIGEPCYRKLQYNHYWAYESLITERMQRLFNFGHLMEPVMMDDLRRHGYEVYRDTAPIVATAGHWRGHTDGIAIKNSTRMLLEMKTHKDSSFKNMRKHKVKVAKPGHYAQMTAYMGYKKLFLALYMAYNKDTSEYYIELVPFDPEYFRELQRKEMEIISADVLLPRVGSNSPSWFECKMCAASNVCFKKSPVRRTCRSCINVVVETDGRWVCSLTNLSLSANKQELGCNDYDLEEIFQ